MIKRGKRMCVLQGRINKTRATHLVLPWHYREKYLQPAHALAPNRIGTLGGRVAVLCGYLIVLGQGFRSGATGSLTAEAPACILPCASGTYDFFIVLPTITA